METIGWGVLGAGNIARRFAASVAHERGSRVVAASGRSREHLRQFVEDIPQEPEHLYLDHESLLDDGAVDAVYVALPHGLHEEWVVRALMAGKAVLCEKPLGLSAAEASHMREVSYQTGSLLMEAMKPRFVPLHLRLARLLGSGELGDVLGVETVQRLPMEPSRGGYVTDPVMGGLLYDVGIYGVSWIEELTDGVPVVESSRTRKVDGVDWFDDARLELGGTPAHLVVEGSADYECTCTIRLERGTLEIDTLHRPTHATLLSPDGHLERELDAPYLVDDMFGEIAHFCGLVRSGATESEAMPLDASVRMAAIVDAIRAAWEDDADGTPPASRREGGEG